MSRFSIPRDGSAEIPEIPEFPKTQQRRAWEAGVIRPAQMARMAQITPDRTR